MNKQAYEKMELVVKAADAAQAKNIVALEVAHLTPLADYYVIMHANNERQLNALLRAVTEDAEEAGYNVELEGKGGNRWLLLDMGDVIVHIFDYEAREEYDLESLWSDAKSVDLSNWLIEK